MSKTIKLIELLNKIANGEEVPEKVKYRGIEYIRIKNTSIDMNYYKAKNTSRYFLEEVANTYQLNEEVEIIEDEIDIDSIEELRPDDIGDVTYVINDLIKAVKQLDKANKN